MAIYSFSRIADSQKSAHVKVDINDREAGEVWRERVNVPVKAGGRTLKWRWFARISGESKVLGKNTRAAMILGAGFTSKNNAAEALFTGREALFN